MKYYICSRSAPMPRDKDYPNSTWEHQGAELVPTPEGDGFSQYQCKDCKIAFTYTAETTAREGV